MSIFLIVLLLITIANLLLGGLVLLKNIKGLVNQVFAFLVFCITFWIISNYLAEQTFVNTLIWNRLTFTAVILLAPAFLYFTYTFGEYSKKNTLKEQIIFFFLPAIFALASLTSFVVKDILITPHAVNLARGPGYWTFLVYFFSYIVTGFYFLLKKFRQAGGTKREQLKFLGLGMFLATFFGVATNLLYPLLTNQHDLSKFGPLGTIFLVALTTYAIVKHRLMDIRLAIRAGILKVLMISVLTAIFFSLAQIYLATLIEPTPKRLIFITALAAVFLVFVYSPLDKIIRKLTDKVLFQREYSAQELLQQLGKKMAESLDLEELLKEIEKTLKEVMRVEYVGFVLAEAETDGWKVGELGGWRRKSDSWIVGKQRKSKAHNFQPSNLPTFQPSNYQIYGFSGRHAYSWPPNNILLEQMRANPAILVYDELKREISEGEESPQRLRKEKIAQELERIAAGILIPLVTQEEVNGLIVLGEKRGGDAFTSSDLDTLETLKYQMGVAIENARLFSEVQGFNRKLSLEVSRATSDLRIKNRNLSVLRKLDTIIINTLELPEMCQKIVDTISWEAGYIGGLIALLEGEGNEEYLRAYAVSDTPIFRKIRRILPKGLGEYRLPLSLDPSNFLVKALRERAPQASKSLTDFYCPPLPRPVALRIEKVLAIKFHVAYPLSAKGKALGVIVFGLSSPYEKLPQVDLNLLQAFMDQAGIAIENAKLYQDLTRVNSELKKANEHLLSLDRMKDELVSVASHELRTPMTAIKSYLWMILNKHQTEIRNPKLQQYLRRAYQSSERMIDLVNDMLSVSRLDTDRMQLEIKPADLKILIKSVISDLESTAKQEKVALTFDEPKGILPKALVDEDKIREVLMNLVGNALKYTPAGGKTWIDLVREDKVLKVGIHDNGPGIAKEDLPRLFQKFGRLNSSFVTAAETGGTGLGLYISRGIIRLHGGKIWVESKKGQGSHFFFTLRTATATSTPS